MACVRGYDFSPSVHVHMLACAWHWRPHPGAQLRKGVGLNQVAIAHVLAGDGDGHANGRQGVGGLRHSLHWVKAATCRVAT